MGDPEDQIQTGLDRMDSHAAFERLTLQRSSHHRVETITKSTEKVSRVLLPMISPSQIQMAVSPAVSSGIPGHNPNTGILRRCEQRQLESFFFFFNCTSPSLLRGTRAIAAAKRAVPQGCGRRWGGCGLQEYSASVPRVLAGHGERMFTYGQLAGEADESYSVTISSPLARNRELNRHTDGQQQPHCRLQEKRMGQEDEHTQDGKWLRQKAALGQEEAENQYL